MNLLGILFKLYRKAANWKFFFKLPLTWLFFLLPSFLLFSQNICNLLIYIQNPRPAATSFTKFQQKKNILYEWITVYGKPLEEKIYKYTDKGDTTKILGYYIPISDSLDNIVLAYFEVFNPQSIKSIPYEIFSVTDHEKIKRNSEKFKPEKEYSHFTGMKKFIRSSKKRDIYKFYKIQDRQIFRQLNDYVLYIDNTPKPLDKTAMITFGSLIFLILFIYFETSFVPFKKDKKLELEAKKQSKIIFHLHKPVKILLFHKPYYSLAMIMYMTENNIVIIGKHNFIKKPWDEMGIEELDSEDVDFKYEIPFKRVKEIKIGYIYYGSKQYPGVFIKAQQKYYISINPERYSEYLFNHITNMEKI